MKRNHVYLGGTVLLALLGASGGYYLWAGSTDKSDSGQANANANAKADGGGGSGDDEDVGPIDVPPMVSDDLFPLSGDQEAVESPPRYASNQGPLDAGTPYQALPVAGGASPLPNQNSLPAADGSPYGGPVVDSTSRYGGSQPLDVNSESLDAANQLNPPPAGATDEDLSGGAGTAGVVSRGQDIGPLATDSEYANPLREAARTAFASDGASDSQTSATSRYGDANTAGPDEAAGSGYGALASDAPQVSPPAPLEYADSAEPLEGTQTNTGSPLVYAQDQSLGAGGYTADSASALPGGRVGVEAGEGSYAGDAYSQNVGNATDASDGYGQGYAQSESQGYEQAPVLSDAANGSGYTANDVPSQGAAAAITDPSATAAAPLHYGGAQATPPQGLSERFGSAIASQDVGVAPPGYIGDANAGLVGVNEGTGLPGDVDLEGPQAPQVSIQKTAPAEIQIGKICTFTIEVRNTGATEARDVRLVDEIPRGTKLHNPPPMAEVVGSQIEWKLGTLAPGEAKSVEVELEPTAEGEIGSVATVHFAAATSVRTRSTRPQLSLSTEVAPTVMIGQQQVIRITLSNPGSGDATGVMLLENVPAGLSHPQGPELELPVGTLRAGESRKLELVLNAETKGIFNNTLVVTGDGNLHAQDVAEIEVVAPEIAVSVNGPQRKYLELPATFVLAVENRGTASAKDIELVSKLPAGLEFVSANNYGEYDEATRSVYWSLAELEPQRKGEVTLVAMPIDLGDQRLEVQAGAELGLADFAEQTLLVEGLAALKSEVTDVSDPIEVGGQTSYEIRIVNQGSKAATNVRIVAVFPEGIQAVDAAGPTEATVEPMQVAFAPLRELSAKADTTYRIDVKGVRPGDQRIRVQIMTDDLEQPINEEESTRVYADQ